MQQKIEDSLSSLVQGVEPAHAVDVPQTNNRQWFVVEATEGGGDKAQLALAAVFVPAGWDIWRPVDVKPSRVRQRSGLPRRDIRIPRFGRYFFIHCPMTTPLLAAIRNAAGVAGVLCGCGTDQPAPVLDSVIEWLRSPEAVAKPCSTMPMKGDQVRVKEGPFALFEGRVSKVDKKGVVEVELLLFGRLTPSIFEAGHVEIVRLTKSRAISTGKLNTKHRVPA